MADYAYIQNTGNLKKFLNKIREISIPSKGVTIKWLETLGFKSKNDRPIIQVMKQIGFLDSNSIPTELWANYRTPEHKKILAGGIKKGYKDLFEIYPDAYKQSSNDLEHFFTKNSAAGKQLIDSTIRTFTTLCELADFNGFIDTIKDNDQQNDTNIDEKPAINHNTLITKNQSNGSGVTINLNIQLTLPDTTDPKVYEHFFAAMKKYIFE